MNTKSQSHKDTRTQEYKSAGTLRVHVSLDFARDFLRGILSSVEGCTCALVLITLLASASAAQTNSVQLDTFYPAPFGNYDRLRLVPLADLSGQSCDPGTLYVNQTSGQMEICNASGNWDTFNDAFWTKDVNDLYPIGINDKVAIGTTTAEFKLTLGNDAGSDGGILAIGFLGSGRALMTSGAGTRFIWYPKKAALRAGTVTGNQWDDTVANPNIGDYSVAMGYNTTASGLASVAMGSGTTASNASTVAMGYNTTASGDTATAMGDQTVASGERSTAMGLLTTASGKASTAMNNTTTASGDYTTAMGYKTTAQAFGSTVVGHNNIVSGTTNSWVPADPLFIIGNGSDDYTAESAVTVLKDGRVGIGTNTPEFRLSLKNDIGTDDGGIFAVGTFDPANPALTTAFSAPNGTGSPRLIWYPKRAAFRAGSLDVNSPGRWNDSSIGNYSVAMGFNPEARSDYSTSLGYWTRARGSNSVAMGKNTDANADTVVAIGEVTATTGNESVAMGNHTTITSTGHAATAMGYYTTVSGNSATAMGYYTTAQAYASLAIGRYNLVQGDPATWVSTDPVFVIGNGTGPGLGEASNALRVLKNGDTIIAGILDAGKGLIIENQTQALGNAETDGHFWLCTDCP